MRDYVHLWQGALFLKREAYEYQRDRKDSFAHGLLFIVLIGVLVAFAGIAGAGLRFATEPTQDAIKNTVLNHVQNMPFYEQMGAAAQQSFIVGYNQTWDRFGGLFVGYPTNSQGLMQLLLSIFTTPLFWIFAWLIYGVLVHLIAGRSSHESNLAHGLGTLALGTSPQLLVVLAVIPGASVSGIVVGLWTLACNFMAVRTAYRVSQGTAFWAVLFPLLLLLIILFLVLCVGLVLIIAVLGRGQQ